MQSLWNAISPNRNQQLQALNYQKELPVSELVNMFLYQKATAKKGYFHSTDGRFAQAWKIAPYDMSTMGIPETIAVSNSFSKILNQFPAGSNGQVLRLTNQDPRHLVDEFMESKKCEAGSMAYKLAESVAQKQIGAMRHPEGFFRDYTKERLEKSRDEFTAEMVDDESAQENFINIEREMRHGKFPLNHELYLVFLWEPSYMFGKFLHSKVDRFKASTNLQSAERVVEQNYNRYLTEFLGFCSDIERRLTDDNWRPQAVTGQGMVNLLYKMLNPSRSKTTKAPPYRGSKTIMENLARAKGIPNAKPTDLRLSIPSQVGYSNIFTSEEGVRIEDKGKSIYHRATSMIGRPENTFPGMLQQAMSSTDGDSIISINFSMTPNLNAKARLGAKRWAGETLLNFRKNNQNAKKQIAEVDEVTHLLESPSVNTKQRMIDASVHIISIDEVEAEAQERAEFLTKALFEIGYVEDKRGDAIFHSTLPGNFNDQSKALLERTQPYLSRNIADLAPIFSEFQGVSYDSKAMMVNNREGTPIFLDLFNGDDAAHTLIAGGTGSGKSFGFNNILASLYAHYTPKMWIIDKGRSYESFCQSLGGNFIELVTNEVKDDRTGQIIKPTCINPLYTEIDESTGKRVKPSEEELEFLTQLLMNMITEGKDITQLTNMNPQTVKNSIYSSIKEFFDDFVEQRIGIEATLSDYIPYLRKVDRQEANGQAIVDMMEMYFGDGPYAQIFDGKLDVNWESDITVLETSRMATSPALSSVILCVFHQIDIYCKFKEPIDRHKIVAVDEAWATLNNPIAANCLGGFFRELRKYLAAVILITQRVGDFVKLLSSESGGAEDGILSNTRNFLFLKCTRDDYKQAQEHLGFTDIEIERWHSLASAPPYFSEILYRYIQPSGETNTGVFRLYASPYSIWMSSTASSDKSIREKRVAEKIRSGLSAQVARIEAIAELAEEYPYGVKFS